MLLVSHVDCPSSARVLCGFFFFSSRRRHTRCSRDWSSDVCSSDLWPVSFQKIWLCFNQSQSRDWPLFYIVNSSARRGMSKPLLRDHLVIEVSHTIAAVVFRNIQRLVGDADEIFFVECIDWIIRNADGSCDGPDARKVFGPDPFANTFRHMNSAGQRCFRKNDRELLATVSSCEIDFAAAGSNGSGQGANHQVAARMTKPVVHLF